MSWWRRGREAVLAWLSDPATWFGPVCAKRLTTSLGVGEASVHEAGRLTTKGRTCTMDVMEVPDVVPVLIGPLPLEALDLVPDPRSGQLIGNPAHGGGHIIEAY